jgi:hypothetical protein
MSDNLHNKWGTELFVLSKTDRIHHAPQSTINLNDEFKRIIATTFRNKFHLQGVSANGSSANVFAILDATRGDTSRCLIAAGSYLCSASFVLCNLATSEFELNSPLSLIREPVVDDDLFVKKTIIALPYHIPGSVSVSELVLYEDMCLVKLHEKLLLYKIQGQAIKSLFFELMLAGNGAVLSDRTLSIIAILSKKHNFTIIVDEIMTAGRTGTMLLLQTKSVPFIKCVSHVTLGKWCQCGIVLVSTEQNIIEQRQQDSTTSPRSNSTSIDLAFIIPYWNKLTTILLMAEVRRDVVLERIRCNYNDAWGKGVMIFTPVKNNTMEGLNHRLLPMLELTNISSGNFSRPFNNNVIDLKSTMNTKIMNTVIKWNDVKIYDKTTNKSVLGYLTLIKYLIHVTNESLDKEVMLSTDEINIGLNRQIKAYPLGIMLNKLHTAGLLEYKLNGKKRLRTWIVSKAFLYN